MKPGDKLYGNKTFEDDWRFGLKANYWDTHYVVVSEVGEYKLSPCEKHDPNPVIRRPGTDNRICQKCGIELVAIISWEPKKVEA